MANTSYAYAVGNVRAHETTLLSRQDLDQLLGIRESARLAAALQDKGYGTEGGDIDTLLKQETDKLWEYLRGVTPDLSLYNAFLYRNDYHNAKVILKGVLRNRPYEGLLLHPGTVEPAALEAAVKEKKYAPLPAHMRQALERSYQLLTETSDTQRSDAVLDTAAMAAMLAAAEETQIPMLLDLMRTTVFYSDVKTALRAARTRRGGEFLDLALCPVDRLELPELKKAALTGESELIGYLEQKDLYSSREAMAAYRESPSAFEKWVDDRLTEIARQGRRVTMGPEALIGYLLGKETEIKAVHILASGLRAGQPEEAVRERLRELYG